MLDLRVRSRLAPNVLKEMEGKILTEREYDCLLTGPARVSKPDGQPLCVYLPGVLSPELLAVSYPILHRLRTERTDNRGMASGTPRFRHPTGKGTRTRSKKVPSAIIGAFDPQGPKTYCRLTPFTRDEGDRYRELFPLFQAIAEEFRRHVPERYRVQMDQADQTRPEWTVPGTPFTTVTVNNSYPCGVHTDSGDLETGFSTLACLRYGDYDGGQLVFPEYRVAVDLHHGDLLLMDAHEWHGNCGLTLYGDDAERISVVAYYRAGMTKCASLREEDEKRYALAERRVSSAASTIPSNSA